MTDATAAELPWQAADKRGATAAAVESTLNPRLDVNYAFQARSVQLAPRLQEL